MTAICKIATEIIKIWAEPSIPAKPYLLAMLHLEKPTDMYGAEDAKSIVLYFLANASSFRGAKARELKAQLKALIRA
jgi:hypothetical protein